MSINQKLQDYAALMRLDKPIGILLLAWPTLWALWLAGLHNEAGVWVNLGIQPNIALIFLTGVFLMRSAGCVINDFADRKIDKHVERTANRPITSGRVSATEALLLFGLLSLLAFSLLFLLDTEHRFIVMLWSLPAIFTATAYPFMKRFFAAPQLVLGIAFSFAIPMVYSAYGHSMNSWLPVCLLIAANLVWVVAYDTQYAMIDRDDDEKIGVKSTAIFFDNRDKLAIACLQFLCVCFLFSLGFYYDLSFHYLLCVGFAAGFFIYQQRLIFYREKQACFQAFLNNSWFGAVVWLGIILASATI